MTVGGGGASLPPTGNVKDKWRCNPSVADKILKNPEHSSAKQKSRFLGKFHQSFYHILLVIQSFRNKCDSQFSLLDNFVETQIYHQSTNSIF